MNRKLESLVANVLLALIAVVGAAVIIGALWAIESTAEIVANRLATWSGTQLLVAVFANAVLWAVALGLLLRKK